MNRPVAAILLLGWLAGAPAAFASDLAEAPAHCAFLTELAQFDLGVRHIAAAVAARQHHLAAHVGGLQRQIRDAEIASAFSELEVMRVEAYLAAQLRALRSPDASDVATRNAGTVHPLPWRGQVLAQKLALCAVEGGNVSPVETGVGTGDQDGNTGGDRALTGQLRIPVGSGPLKADVYMLMLLALGTICLALILRALIGRTQRRSRRVYCHVPVHYSVGGRVRQGWLLDLSCHGCKLQTHGESWDIGTTVRIGVAKEELSGNVAWTSRNYAGIDLQHVLEPDDVDRIASGDRGLPQGAC